MPRSFALLLFVVAAVLAMVGQLKVTRDVITGRAPGLSPDRKARWLEIAWAVLPAIVLLWVLVATWHAVDAASAAPLGSNTRVLG